MSIRFTFDKNKALASILLIAKKLMEKRPSHNPDYYKILKIIFFAEIAHLAKYGIPVIGDHYIAMQHGPVPSKTYDMIKAAKGDGVFPDPMGLSTFFKVSGTHVLPLQDPDMDEFSKSDLECLDKAINENCDLDFGQLHKKSATPAFRHALQNDEIDIADAVEDWGGSQSIIGQLKEFAGTQSFISEYSRR